MHRLAPYPPILKYHRIGSPRPDHVPTVSCESFERQMSYLARFGWRVASLEQLERFLRQGGRIPWRHVAITFDDGYEDVFAVVRPLLKRMGFPATVFIAPAEIGLPGFLTWGQVEELAADGFGIGNHTMHHAYLPHVPEARLAEELLESKHVIETHIQQPVRFLSYPVGAYTRRVVEVVSAHYAAAYTTNRAFVRNGLERFALRRIKMTERDANPITFLAKVSGYYDTFRRLAQPA